MFCVSYDVDKHNCLGAEMFDLIRPQLTLMIKQNTSMHFQCKVEHLSSSYIKELSFGF